MSLIKKLYMPQRGKLYAIPITVRDEVFTHEFTDLLVQVLLALVATMKMLSNRMERAVFLGSLACRYHQVESELTVAELLIPHLVIKEIYYAEQLLENSEKVHCLLKVRDLLTTMSTTNKISRNNQQSVLTPTNLMNSKHAMLEIS